MAEVTEQQVHEALATVIVPGDGEEPRGPGNDLRRCGQGTECPVLDRDRSGPRG